MDRDTPTVDTPTADNPAVGTSPADTLIVVGAAIIRDGRVLAAQRAEPAALRGRWEFPGGKVDPGESPADALVRECREELGITVRARETVGADVPFPATPGRTRPAVLRLLRADLVDGEPRALEHLSLRWLTTADLGTLDWLPADVPFLGPIGDLLALTRRHGSRGEPPDGTPRNGVSDNTPDEPPPSVE